MDIIDYIDLILVLGAFILFVILSWHIAKPIEQVNNLLQEHQREKDHKKS